MKLIKLLSSDEACVKLFRKAKWANGLKMVKDNKPYRKDKHF
jgi:hypothetical protein